MRLWVPTYMLTYYVDVDDSHYIHHINIIKYVLELTYSSEIIHLLTVNKSF